MSDTVFALFGLWSDPNGGGRVVQPVVLVNAGLTLGMFLLVIAWLRGRPTVREGATQSRIAGLVPGRFRLQGRVVPIRTTSSEVDGSPCVYLERARYQHVGVLPLLREVERHVASHAFYLDDGSGRLLVDPGTSWIDCVTLSTDGGLLRERRLRAGEEIELIGNFRSAEQPCYAPEYEGSEGPYRAPKVEFEAYADDVGPPRITYRTEDGMESASADDLTLFLRGSGGLMIATSLLLSVMT